MLSFHKGLGYNKVYTSGREPEEGITWSLKREPSVHSPNKGEEEEYEEDEEGEYDEGKERKYEEEGEEEEGEEEEESDNGSQEKSERLVGRVDGSSSRPFILPKIWTVKDFYSTMSQKVFNTFCDHHQIPENIPLRLPGKFEKCYSEKMADVGMYDAMFTTGLRLPLTDLHCQLINYLLGCMTLCMT